VLKVDVLVVVLITVVVSVASATDVYVIDDDKAITGAQKDAANVGSVDVVNV